MDNDNKLDRLMDNMLNLQTTTASLQAAMATMQNNMAVFQTSMLAIQTDMRRIEAETRQIVAQIFAALQRHEQLLANLPDAVRERIGYQRPAQP